MQRVLGRFLAGLLVLGLCWTAAPQIVSAQAPYDGQSAFFPSLPPAPGHYSPGLRLAPNPNPLGQLRLAPTQGSAFWQQFPNSQWASRSSMNSTTGYGYYPQSWVPARFAPYYPLDLSNPADMRGINSSWRQQPR